MNIQDTIRQLSFIRYLFIQAQNQVRQPYPQSIAAVLTLHDCVELFLDLAAGQPNVSWPLNINVNKLNFLDYWQMQLPQGQQLDHRATMDKFNRVRVDLKHHGIWPAAQELGASLTRVSDFLEDSTRLVFGRDFGSVSMVDLVALPSSKQDLQQAETFLKAGQIQEAADAIAYAFEDLIWDRHQQEEAHARQQRRSRTRPLREAHSLSIASTREGDFLKDLEESANAAQAALEVIGWGLDYPRYLRFRALIPEVMWSSPTRDRQYSRPLRTRLDPPTADGCQFCLDFVIEAALHLQSLPVY